MTATASSKQRGPDPQPTHRDPADQPARPGTIPWELLGASEYRTALTDVGSWLAWLVPTYRIPPSVIPPCWFLHPGLIEELGHLWTGWRITRHPESGVGMVGLDWDGHRDRAAARLRELVATAGCNGASHSTKPGPPLNRDQRLWEANLQTEITVRTTRSTDRAILNSAKEVLLKAEQHSELAVKILGDVAADPAHPTAAEIGQCAVALENSALAAAADAQRRSLEARTYLGNAARESLVNTELTEARDDLLDRIAAGCAAAELVGATRRWPHAASTAVPIADALRRAAGATAGRSAAANYMSSPKTQHADNADLLPPSKTPS